MSSTTDAATNDRTDYNLVRTVAHLLGDHLADADEPIPARVALSEVKQALQECAADAVGPLNPSTVTNAYDGNIVAYAEQHAFPKVDATRADGTVEALDAVAPGDELIGVELVGSRPANLPPIATLVTDADDGTQASHDFTVVEEVGPDTADILADHGDINTWDDVRDTDTDALADLPQIGKATARDLKAEANTRLDTTEELAIEAYTRSINAPTTDDGTGRSYELDEVQQPPGAPLDPRDHGDLHGWHYLKDIGHPDVPEQPDQLKTRELPNGQTDREALCSALAKGHNPILIGPPGTGKNTLVRWCFAERNTPLTVIPVDEDMLTEELLGTHKVTEDGVVVFEDGPLPTRAKYGGGIWLDELHTADSGLLKVIYKLAEEDSKLFVKGKNEVIEPHPEFYLGATLNPNDPDASEVARALASRFLPIVTPALPQSKEVDLLDQKVNEPREVISKDKLERLVSIANDARDRAENGMMPYITTRDLEHVIDLYDGGNDLQGALDMVLDGMEAMGISGGPMGGLDDDARDDILSL